MAGAVNVSVVTLCGLVLNVGSGDRYTTSSLFGSLVDLIKRYVLAKTQSLMQSEGDSSSQSGFAMVDVADGTDVNMGFGSLKLSFSHFRKSSLYNALPGHTNA
jgi:hypothetical protein